MAIDYSTLKNWPFPDLEHTYDDAATMLYALGVGMGQDPMDAKQLPFVYEENLRALPTMAVVLGYPGFWLIDPATGVDWKQVLHGEQGLIVHSPLPATGTVIGKSRIDEIIDKGPGKGALIYSSRDIVDKATGTRYCTVTGTTFCRADGGFGGPSGPVKPVHAIPERRADVDCTLATRPEQALIYRLSGDRNPLHADPEVAAVAKFPKPILHGLATFGIAGHAILRELCGYDPTRLKQMHVRFSSPVFPGETIRTEIWREGGRRAAFRCWVVERNVMVINNGMIEYVEN
ncbi:MAG: 3-alpha,7-alpha,12-alpha-trihydroxy-5-beta-cholest-24-enoyl-CoA hydratase [Betaproteobacteria bacterium]|nr:3-alpha,7-alpha,12-alpha-trihydroxy-5-beta-cholest-24-enoyl-CoA hydratase [Betaproteobacteria bacterium]